MEKTLNLIKSDPWLEPYAAAIRTLLRDTYISVCIVQTKDGLSVNGRPMRPIFTW